MKTDNMIIRTAYHLHQLKCLLIIMALTITMKTWPRYRWGHQDKSGWKPYIHPRWSELHNYLHRHTGRCRPGQHDRYRQRGILHRRLLWLACWQHGISHIMVEHSSWLWNFCTRHCQLWCIGKRPSGLLWTGCSHVHDSDCSSRQNIINRGNSVYIRSTFGKWVSEATACSTRTLSGKYLSRSHHLQLYPGIWRVRSWQVIAEPIEGSGARETIMVPVTRDRNFYEVSYQLIPAP